ncbi:virulence associated lipoprotein (plasmid) [Borreliella yangtzensis]|uniref:virulence associated lipoprotein n=1 Tax=Borreliella yangtzensis TaxID=683292 RepID=UPI003B215E3A
MKYFIIINIFFFLILACTPEDFGFNKKNIKRISNKKALKPNAEMDFIKKEEEDPNKKIKNKLLNDLNNLMEVANVRKEKCMRMVEKEPEDRYGLAFRAMRWSSGAPGLISDNSKGSRNYRKNVYTILDIDTKDLKEFSSILELINRIPNIFNPLSYLGNNFHKVIDHLYSKKDTLDELNISDLEKLKQSLEKVLSIIEVVSEELKQLLLDYQSDRNSIKTDITKRTSHIDTLSNQMGGKVTETDNLRDVILSI